MAVDLSGFGSRSKGKERDSFPPTHAKLGIHTKIDDLDLDEREFVVESIHFKSLIQY